ncbi:MAG: glycosyltransferase family A protein [Imperialibacter sp.]|uniref:glycosyltransferase family 2 protein n=1 Tax=Imperialibacter sp. TaxID=2038411 RepID=UPI0032EFC5CD
MERRSKLTKISVIIPTFNGANRVLTTLKSIGSQGYKAFEVIVVIDGSNDGTFERLNAYDPDFKIKILEQNNRGRAGSRNRGASEAEGNLLVFVDDDMRLTSDCLSAHHKHHEVFEDLILSGGQIGDDTKNTVSDFQKFKSHLERQWHDRFPDGLMLLDEDNLYLTAAHMSIKKTTFERLGGFDERLTDKEDFEFALRALNLGARVGIDKTILAYHDDFQTCAGYVNRRRQYLRAHEKLLDLSVLYRATHRHSIENEGVKRPFYSLFSFRVWVRWVDEGRLRFLPVRVRYWLYRIIIWSQSSYFPGKKID